MSKRSPLVESTGEPVELTRAYLPELLKTMHEDGHAPHVTWNAVDALELLVESGHFRAARTLAESVCDLVDGSPRSRLFRSYAALCSLMEGGQVLEHVQSIESVYVQIQNGGHSVGDKVRAAMLLARGVFVGVSLGVLPEADVLRARAALSAEFERCAGAEHYKLRLQVGLELVKTLIHAAQPELLQGSLLLQLLERESAERAAPADLSFELLRVRYHLERAMSPEGPLAVSPEGLRQEGAALGPLGEGLAEISIARLGTRSVEAQAGVERALHAFDQSRFASGMLEAILWLADTAMEREHTSRASVLFARAEQVARECGVLQGVLLAWLGSFQCALSSGDTQQARVIRKMLQDALETEIGIGVVGLSVVSAAQNMGDTADAIACADRCERFFRGRGIPAAEAQALFFLGTCFASSGQWAQAKKAWSAAVAIEDRRRAFVSVSDKRAALAQAIAMAEYGERGYLSDKVSKQVHDMLQEAEDTLALFDGAPAALRTRAKVLSIRAQMCVIAKDSVAAVSHLHKARGLYERLDAQRDIALTDALAGLALLEVGKARGGDIFEEAHSMLEHALKFFDSPQHNPIRWKLKYYLSISAYLSSQARGAGNAGMSWREASASWLRGAMEDVEELREVDDGGSEASEFSPGLRPEVLEPLKRALGIKAKARAVSAKRGAAAEKLPDDGGYIH